MPACHPSSSLPLAHLAHHLASSPLPNPFSQSSPSSSSSSSSKKHPPTATLHLPTSFRSFPSSSTLDRPPSSTADADLDSFKSLRPTSQLADTPADAVLSLCSRSRDSFRRRLGGERETGMGVLEQEEEEASPWWNPERESLVGLGRPEEGEGVGVGRRDKGKGKSVRRGRTTYSSTLPSEEEALQLSQSSSPSPSTSASTPQRTPSKPRSTSLTTSPAPHSSWDFEKLFSGKRWWFGGARIGVESSDSGREGDSEDTDEALVVVLNEEKREETHRVESEKLRERAAGRLKLVEGHLSGLLPPAERSS
ncbi:hypothetical protein T439DRAFT_384157 [Meredithblackwellia eburnea MCA 4105]